MAQALEERSPKLAGIYRTAAQTISNEPQGGLDRASISVVCHCMRELMLGLPAVFSQTSSERPRPSSSALASKLPKLIARHPGLDLEADQDVVPVPRAVARAFDTLVKTVVQEDGRNRRNTAALLTGDHEAHHPAIEQWKKAYGFFVSWVHLDRDEDGSRESPSREDVLRHIRVVEDVVDVRSKEFFENLHAVEGLLADINAQIEEGE